VQIYKAMPALFQGVQTQMVLITLVKELSSGRKDNVLTMAVIFFVGSNSTSE